jgi:hypothetical protein
MISDLLNLVDRVIQLFEYRNKQFETLYEKLLKPTFDDLLLIHADYIKMFEETRKLLPSGLSDDTTDPLSYMSSLSRPAEFLRVKRRELEPVRRKLKVLAERLEKEENLDKDVRAYVESLVSYFMQSVPEQGTASVGLLNEIENLVSRGLSASQSLNDEWQSVDRQLHDLLSAHRNRYARLCESFAQLQIRAATSP